jgi:DnaJ family protein C protein 19
MSWAVLLILTAGGLYASRALPRIFNQPGVVQAAGRTGAAYLRHEHAFSTAMSRREALLILGFGAHEAPEAPTVQKQFRKLVAQRHSDIGGSPLIAQKINEAREHLNGK